MTQTLDVSQRVSGLDQAGPAATPASTATAARASSQFGTFAITFGIAFAILYTVFERFNWPLFTYHPAVGKLDFWMHAARSGEGPPMYWYGWLALTGIVATAIAWIATRISAQWLQRATLFCCALAAIWSVSFAIWVFNDNRTSFDTDLVQSIVWMSAIPGFIGAAAVSYFVPLQWAQRAWTSWLFIMPIGGLVILGYSLKTYFLR